MSGIEPSAELLSLYEQMKLRHSFKEATFRLVSKGLDDSKKSVFGWEVVDKKEQGGGGVQGAVAAFGGAAKAPMRVVGGPPGGGGGAGGAAGAEAAGPAVPAPIRGPHHPDSSDAAIALAGPAAPSPHAPAPAPAPAPSSGGGDSNRDAWESLVSRLPPSDGVFALFDFSAKTPDGRLVSKLILLKWVPDTCDVATKMTMAATFQTLKTRLTGLGKAVEACDPSDVDYAGIAASLV